MACSKIFSGDLPEISSDIIQNLRNNFKTLYSLALVNRFWCRLAIPLLWEDPFSIKYRSFHFLDTYFLFLSDNDKIKIKEILSYEFASNLQKPLFNYPSLIKTLNTYRIHLHVSSWTYNITSTSVQKSSNDKDNFLTTIEFTPNVGVDKEKIKVVCTALFKFFIENNASLNNLYMRVDNKFPYQFFCDI